jgi:hypothetical protein
MTRKWQEHGTTSFKYQMHSKRSASLLPPTQTPEDTPSDQEKEIPEMQNSQATKPLVWWEEIPAEARGLTFNSPSSR